MKTVENTSPDIRKVIADNPLFSNLGQDKIEKLAKSCTLVQHSIGKPIVTRGMLPDAFFVLCSGKVRTLYQDNATGSVQTLRLLGPGDVFGWVTLMRRQPTEIVTASEDTTCLQIPAASINTIVNDIPSLYEKVVKVTDPSEICALLDLYFADDPVKDRRLQEAGIAGTKELALKLFETAEIVDTGFTKKIPAKKLKWLVSRSSDPAFKPGSEYIVSGNEIPGSISLRLIGLDFSFMKEPSAGTDRESLHQSGPESREPHAEAEVPEKKSGPRRKEFAYAGDDDGKQLRSKGYPFFRGKGIIEETLACFQMLGDHFNVPVKKDLIRSIVGNQISRNGKISLQDCGGVGVVMGMRAQIVTFEQEALSRLKMPAMIRWNDSFALLYHVSRGKVILASPTSSGVKVFRVSEFWDRWENKGEALVLDVREDTPNKTFGFGWFAPSIRKYRGVLAEVMIASFFTQIMTLVNPLLFMIIIDQVIVRNSYSTLHVLGMFMVIIAILQAVLNSLRTYLFVDTSNRIDVALGAEVIDHLLRLPLRFFEKRPVGELSSRIGELERIRQFLTGTALSVVLDAVFSVVYVVVLFAFSWKLAVMSLSVVPLIGLVTFLMSPVIRQQLREKAIRHGITNAYLIEVLSGIQTVKSQNIELRARWNWQEKYAAYVRQGFKPVVSGTLANSTNSFLSQASGLIVIWAGAYLVLNHEMTLGQLIAFRIIAGYITSPVMRLAQLWQNFQETGMSLERLSDIVDSPQEGGRAQLSQIPLPLISGEVVCENVSFRFRENTPMVLKNVNITIPAGKFVGIVGESGSGKSTFAKLVQRLYSLEEGRIFIDHYDISKVELNSLRSQIGIVPQDPMLFNVSVKENIALTNPDASDADIINAATIAEAHEFIMALPTGYSTPVGEKGSSLSGGQRQRIAIARTILQNPGMIILDEATSALDPETESRLTTNMIHAFKGKTVLFITHRLNSIKGASLILCFHDGCIDEAGTHEELMAKRGRYYSLFQKQSYSIPLGEDGQ